MIFALPGSSFAAAGDLDTTFDTDGVALYDSGNDDNGTAVAIQANGKIVVAGESNNGTDYDVAVFRFCHPFRRR